MPSPGFASDGDVYIHNIDGEVINPATEDGNLQELKNILTSVYDPTAGALAVSTDVNVSVEPSENPYRPGTFSFSIPFTNIGGINTKTIYLRLISESSMYGEDFITIQPGESLIQIFRLQ